MSGKNFSLTLITISAISYFVSPVITNTALVLAQQKSSTSSVGKDDTRTLSILSIPAGLKVYLMPDTGLTDTKGEEWIQIATSHPSIDQRFYKGTTPVVLQNITSGKYFLGITPLKFLDRTRLSEIDETLPVKAYVSSSPIDPNSTNTSGAVIYSITKVDSIGQRFIVLATPQDMILDSLDSVYPTKSMFSFDEVKLAKELTEDKRITSVFSEPEIQKTIALLRRGGKVRLVKSNRKVIIEILPDGKWATLKIEYVQKK